MRSRIRSDPLPTTLAGSRADAKLSTPTSMSPPKHPSRPDCSLDNYFAETAPTAGPNLPAMRESVAPFYLGWRQANDRLIEVIGGLSHAQLAWTSSPHMWPIW